MLNFYFVSNNDFSLVLEEIGKHLAALYKTPLDVYCFLKKQCKPLQSSTSISANSNSSIVEHWLKMSSQ